MKILIGNIPPQTEVQIIYSYLQELETSLNSFWLYKIPSTLTPRYQQEKIPNAKNNQETNIVTMSQNSPDAYTWSIEVTVDSSSKIMNINSPTHQILILEKNQQETKIKVQVEKIGNQELPNKDFVLLFKNEQIRFPSVTLGRNSDNQTCAMLSFVPNFANCQIDDAIKQSLSNQQDFPVDMDSARGEYIFLIDRSGSMGGQRMEQAKQALILFLKSMPMECLFNIVSFGSNFSLMFPSSVKYEKEKLQQAIKQIEKFTADFGGTEIYDPLCQIFNNPRKKGYPRQIFLLTDGDVSEADKVHTIGIGSGASSYLIQNCAKSGKGISSFVNNNENMSGQIISMLQQSLTPCLDNFIFKYDKEIIDVIIPTPNSIPCILKNEPFCVYVFFKQGVQNINTLINLACYDSCLNQNLEFPIQINENNCEFKNEVSKLGMAKMIKCLEEETFSKQDQSQSTFKARLENLKQHIVDLSITNQILSTKTSFICTVKTVSDEMASMIQESNQIQKVIIPSIESVDYQNLDDDDDDNFYQIKASQASLGKGSFRAHGMNLKKKASTGVCKPKCIGACISKCAEQKESKSFFKSLAPNFFGKKSKVAQPIYTQCCDIQDQSLEEELCDFKEKKGIKQTQKLDQQNIYQLIIDEVQLEGYWNMNQKILNNIIKNTSNFDSLIPQEIIQIKQYSSQNIWFTILILMWLQEKQFNQKNQWSLIEKKALNWLKKATNDQWQQFKTLAISQLK